MAAEPSAPRAALWAIPGAMALHNLEEALTFGRYLPLVRERAPAVARPLVAGVTYRQLLVALAAATLLAVAVAGWAWLRPHSRAARWGALVLQAVMAINVVSHAAAALVVTRGYAPGLVTALLLELPLSVYVFRRASRERWLRRGALRLIAPAALLVHGPGLVALILLAGRLSR